MVRVVALTFFIVLGLVAVGCENGKKSSASTGNAGVLDLPATPANIPPTTPVAAQPVSDSQPILYSSAPAASNTSIATQKTYTVKKGDTLFAIAKSNYGTGRDWQKIAAANPGLEPSKLKVGQQIVIP